ncbi:MAG: protein TolR [Proteobacteria bacterium]|nr:protein TolR [Pseudomonadota bacterium]
MTSGDRDGLMSEINVTPFVDVMLVLLIIFMVTAPMMTQGINIDLPQASSGPLESENEQLLVSINKDNQVYINDIAVSVEILKEKLESILVNQKNREVYLKADKGVPYGAVMRVMSEIKNAGVEKLGMVTMPEESEPTSDRQK